MEAPYITELMDFIVYWLTSSHLLVWVDVWEMINMDGSSEHIWRLT